MSSNHDSEIFKATFIPPALVVGWTWLLHFPWDWVLYTVLAVEILFFLVTWGLEQQASHVSGASGWMLFFSFFLQFFIVVGITIFRILVLFGQIVF